MTGIETIPAPMRSPRGRLSASQRAMVGIAVASLILFYGLFFIFPILYALVGSFFDWMPMKGRFDWAGLSNYQKILGNDILWLSLRNTLVFTVIVTLLRTAFGLILAALISEAARGKALLRTLYFIPVITSTVAVSMVWKWLFETSNGPINYLLALIGLPQQGFLKDPSMALGCIMVMTVWKELGYAMVVYMAGISGISRSLYESASIDGSTRWKSFRYITVPMLRSTTLFILVTSFITYSQTFTQIDLMTGGGPSKSTYTMVYLLYQEAFRNFRFGRASAIAFVLFAFIFVFSLLQILLTQKQGGD